MRLPFLTPALALVPAFFLVENAAAQVGTPYCFGNGCPCANDDPGAGCGNDGIDGDPQTGALLTGLGSADVFGDDLVLLTSGIKDGGWGVVLMGTAKTPTPNGDGLHCVGDGPGGLRRFPIAAANKNGDLSLSAVVSTSEAFGPQGTIVAGSTWSFQTWYRDSQGPCGNGSNVSNGLTILFEAPGTSVPLRAEMAGTPLLAYPWFERVGALNEGDDLYAAIDPTRMPWLVGVTGDLYVVAARTEEEWELDATLTDVRGGGPQSWTIVAGGVQQNTLLVDQGTLPGTQGTDIGIGYDLVFDRDADGVLGAGDVIDGLDDTAGVYVVRDTAAAGPYAVTEVFHDGGVWLDQDIYYPSNIAGLGAQPLIVVSHGNGHNYQWYDHIGYHMASYGYVVMSHSNNTGPGIDAASLTTLQNTDHFLGNLDTIAGGVLDGHVDGSRIVWIGHSRGGEGVVRAYDRLSGPYDAINFDKKDIQLVSSIAPTVFLNPTKSDPHKANYHLWIGSADSDVTGGPGSPVTQSFALLERARGRKLAIVLQGMGHGVFHDGGGSWWAQGPCLNDRTVTHAIMRGYFLPLVAHFVHGDEASLDFLRRPWESFKPIGHPPNPNGCVVVTFEYHEKDGKVVVIDDFESEPDTGVSSSGGAVSFTVTNLLEGSLDDANSTLTWQASDPMNGMTREAFVADETRGIVFDWQQPAVLEFEVPSAERNLADDTWLSFRACQGTRHPDTIAALEDLTFGVTLEDEFGATSTIDIGVWGGGIVEPYQRAGDGSGVGWANEFETVRIRLTDFLTDGSGLRLARIETIRFEFGAPFGSTEGRLGLDDLEIVRN